MRRMNFVIIKQCNKNITHNLFYLARVRLQTTCTIVVNKTTDCVKLIQTCLTTGTPSVNLPY